MTDYGLLNVIDRPTAVKLGMYIINIAIRDTASFKHSIFFISTLFKNDSTRILLMPVFKEKVLILDAVLCLEVMFILLESL